MGYNARNDEIGDNITRMQRRWEAQREALATVRRFNATLSAKGKAWFWPKIAAALTANHHWLVINCDSCGTVMDLDLRVKPFGGLIASGWHTAGLMTRLFIDHYLTKVASLGSPGGDELRWIKPVRPGDTLSVRVTVLKAVPSKSKPNRGAVTSFVAVFNQASEVV